jgi:uncharacterized protein YybS (DUF2232 family)
VVSTRNMVEASLLAGLAAALFLAARFLPVAGIAFSFLCPAPLVVLGLRHSIRFAALGLIAATAIVLMLSGPTGAAFFFLGFGVLGVGLGVLAGRCSRGVDVILYGILVSLGSKILLMVAAKALTGVDPFSMDPKEITEVVDRIFAFYGTFGASSDALSQAREQVMAALRLLPTIFPTILIMASALDCYLSYVVSAAVVRRTGGDMPSLPSFSEWRFPKSVLGALVVSLLLPFLGQDTEWGLFATKIAINLKMCIHVVFLLQGVSLLWFFLRRWSWKAPFGAIIIVMVVFIPLFSTVAVMAGAGDMWFDVRNRVGRGSA